MDPSAGGWWFDEWSDLYWFALAPITTVPSIIYVASWHIAEEPHPYGEPDYRDTIRNAGIWASIVYGNLAYHAYMHPGKYGRLSGSGAYKLAGHLAAPAAPALLPAVATAAAVGWAATGELHGAVPPATASGIGMPLTPELYSRGTSSNPAGWDFRGWWDRLF